MTYETADGITSDAGLLAFRELDDALDLTPIASDYLQESRTGRNIRHHLVPLLRQSIYSRLAGYDDTNDAERLSQDPASLGIAKERRYDPETCIVPMAGRNSLSRW